MEKIESQNKQIKAWLESGKEIYKSNGGIIYKLIKYHEKYI